jgi:glycosyltransferase involved in cell wall biosynthesis
MREPVFRCRLCSSVSETLRPGRKLTVASVAFPFAPISPDAVGGAEQVLSNLDKALVTAGHRSIVIAQRGSSTAGELRPVSLPEGDIDDCSRAAVHDEVRRLISESIVGERPDVIHFHGVDFADYIPDDGPPCLVTLHLPLDWYSAHALRPLRGDVSLVPVSASQARRAPEGARLSWPIENGVAVQERPGQKGEFALTLGRICTEKGVHEALDAARAAGSELLVAGSVFPYPDHRQYWTDMVKPRLDRARRWIGRVAGQRKQALLSGAKCLLVPSRAAETSSLVAMEALAAGTPVIAYPSGALPEIVDHGRTGFIVEDSAGMAEAIHAVRHLDPDKCRSVARDRFPLRRMIDSYFDEYRRLAA